jgi:hypothetical protein
LVVYIRFLGCDAEWSCKGGGVTATNISEERTSSTLMVEEGSVSLKYWYTVLSSEDGAAMFVGNVDVYSITLKMKR